MSERRPSHLDCREVFERLDDFVDRALSSAEIAQIESHLDDCAPCAKELGFSACMIEEIKHKLRRIRAPDRLRARITEMLSSEDHGPST